MDKCFISNLLCLNHKGHEKFAFVDVNLNNDNRLFIDPCLIERGTDLWSREANSTVQSFFDCLYKSLRNNKDGLDSLLAHGSEQNATKFGYGNGENGKGKTQEGLLNSLTSLTSLVNEIPTISRPLDLPLLIKDFAEDCMSDLLTNILHEQLNVFTATQMNSLGCLSQCEKSFWFWDRYSCSWQESTRPCWLYNNKELLLVPKWIVRKNYLFSVHQYLYTVIIDRMRDNGYQNLNKIDIWNNIPRTSVNWEYEKVIEFSKQQPDALLDYHNRVPQHYNRKYGCMSDDDLDAFIYQEQPQKRA